MAPRKHCACDRTSESLISPSLEFFDTVHEPFVNLVGKVSDVRDSILWLNPFRGIPKGPRLSRFDAIFLDDDGKVMGRAENYAEVEFRPLESKAASALIFPPHTLNSVRINEGDQLRICGGGRILLESAELLATLENEKQLSDEQAKCFKMHAGAATSVDTTDLRESRPIRTHAEEWTKTSEAGNWTLKQRFLAWLIGKKVSNERRLAARLPNPGLVAYHWTGGPPRAYELGDVSERGLYLLTDERWLPGTRIVMTLQKQGSAMGSSEDISRVETEVVRWGIDGVGCSFVESGFVDLNTGEIVEGRKFDRVAFQGFLDRNACRVPGANKSIMQA